MKTAIASLLAALLLIGYLALHDRNASAACSAKRCSRGTALLLKRVQAQDDAVCVCVELPQ